MSGCCEACGQRLPHNHAPDVESACRFCRELATDELLRAAWDEVEGLPCESLSRMSLVALVMK